MAVKKQNYVAQYLDLNRVGQWNSAGQGSPMFRFEAVDDKEALDMALSFGKNPQMYASGIKKRDRIPEVSYQLSKLYHFNEIDLTRTRPRKRLEVCLGKNGFEHFV